MEQISSFPPVEEMPALLGSLKRFREVRALVIGDLMLDTYIEGSASRLCREGPVPVVKREQSVALLGGAANVAVNLSALGAQVVIIGLVGDDQAGACVRASLTKCGVDSRHVVEDQQLHTLEKLRVIADGQYVVRIDTGLTNQYSEITGRRLRKELDRALSDIDVIVISDYGYGVVSEPLIDEVAKLRERHCCQISVDAKTLRRYRRLRPTVIVPNLAEALMHLGQDPALNGALPDLQEIDALNVKLRDDVLAERSVITLGAHGAAVVDEGGRSFHVAARPVARAFDVGAGDSFLAALSLALATGTSTEMASRLAVLAAGIAVSKQRTAIVTFQELAQRVSLWSADTHGTGIAAQLRLIEQLSAARREGRTIVLASGIFDILHAGHVAYLNRARTLGDLLVVAVNSDDSAHRIKGTGRPINRLEDRMALIAALDAVDLVASFDEATPASLIHALLPDVYVKGGDYEDQELPEAEAVREVGGRTVVLPLIGNFSTSDTIARITDSPDAARLEASL